MDNQDTPEKKEIVTQHEKLDDNKNLDAPQAVQEETQKEAATEAKEPEPDEREINWRKFREQRAKEREELKALQKREQERLQEEQRQRKLAEESAQAFKKALAVSTDEQPEEDEIESKIEKKLRERLEEYERKQEQKRREQEAQELPIRLKNQFPDFEAVVSQENVDYLEYHHPETFLAIKSMPEGMDKYKAIYGAMKRYAPSAAEVARDTARMEKNLSKPTPASKVQGKTSSTSNFDLSEERMKANWERMQRELRTL